MLAKPWVPYRSARAGPTWSVQARQRGPHSDFSRSKSLASFSVRFADSDGTGWPRNLNSSWRWSRDVWAVYFVGHCAWRNNLDLHWTRFGLRVGGDSKA